MVTLKRLTHGNYFFFFVLSNVSPSIQNSPPVSLTQQSLLDGGWNVMKNKEKEPLRSRKDRIRRSVPVWSVSGEVLGCLATSTGWAWCCPAEAAYSVDIAKHHRALAEVNVRNTCTYWSIKLWHNFLVPYTYTSTYNLFSVFLQLYNGTIHENIILIE